MLRSGSKVQRHLGCAMIIAAWLVVLGLFYLLFDDYIDRQRNPNRNLSVRSENSGAELTIQRNRDGHYVLPGLINGRPVSLMVDTGATAVAIPAHLGPTLGLVPGPSQWAITANGQVQVRATSIAELSFGPFRLREVRANLNPGIAGHQVLLGMSALRQMEFTQRGDTLILRQNRS